MFAFVRLTTEAGLFLRPLTTDAAFDLLDAWLAQPSAVMVTPTARHASTVRKLLAAVGSGRNLINDAHLGALAIDYRASVVSFDHDFGRFPGLSWTTPT